MYLGNTYSTESIVEKLLNFHHNFTLIIVGANKNEELWYSMEISNCIGQD